jgi:hypothetical protein
MRVGHIIVLRFTAVPISMAAICTWPACEAVGQQHHAEPEAGSA